MMMRVRVGVLLLVLVLGVMAQAQNLTLRGTKGSELTIAEFDANHTVLQTWVYTSAGACVWARPASSGVTSEIVTIPAAGGARYPALMFTDVATDMVYAVLCRAPTGWTTGTVQVVGSGVDIGGAPAGHALGFDVAAQCRTHNADLNDTWGTPQLLTIAFATQNRLVSAQTAAITPNGTCTGGTEAAPVYVNMRLKVNTGTFACGVTAEEQENCKLVNVDIRFVRP